MQKSQASHYFCWSLSSLLVCLPTEHRLGSVLGKGVPRARAGLWSPPVLYSHPLCCNAICEPLFHHQRLEVYRLQNKPHDHTYTCSQCLCRLYYVECSPHSLQLGLCAATQCSATPRYHFDCYSLSPGLHCCHLFPSGVHHFGLVPTQCHCSVSCGGVESSWSAGGELEWWWR